MHATLPGSRQALTGPPIRGTFYPGEGPMTTPARPPSSFLPKLVALLGAIVLARAVAAARRHGGPRGGGRRAAIARLHRELHAHDEAVPA